MDPNSKQFLQGFLQYLQSYYGSASRPMVSVQQPHLPSMPIFQSTDKSLDAQVFPMGNPMSSMDMGMGMAGGSDIASQLNSMFPRRDPYGMN